MPPRLRGLPVGGRTRRHPEPDRQPAELADEVLAAYPRILPTAYAQFLDGGKAAGPPHDGDTCTVALVERSEVTKNACRFLETSLIRF
jgi:hypothetical protein